MQRGRLRPFLDSGSKETNLSLTVGRSSLRETPRARAAALQVSAPLCLSCLAAISDSVEHLHTVLLVLKRGWITLIIETSSLSLSAFQRRGRPTTSSVRQCYCPEYVWSSLRVAKSQSSLLELTVLFIYSRVITTPKLLYFPTAAHSKMCNSPYTTVISQQLQLKLFFKFITE